MIEMLGREEAANHIEIGDVIPALEAAFIGLATGTSVQPGQATATLPEEAGDVIYYPAVLMSRKVVGVTVSPYLSALAASDKPPVTAYTFLLSAESGTPLLLCDSLSLIRMRTGATTALAVRKLAPPGSRRIAIVGTGPIAEWHARFALEIGSWDSVIFYSRSIQSSSSSSRRRQLESLSASVSFADTLPDAVSDADIVMLCTSSAIPVVRPSDLKSQVLITSVSTDGPKAHEIPPGDLRHLDVYCDYRETTPLSAGEMVIAAEEGGWNPSDIIADLPELLSGPYTGPAATGRRRFFRSIGLGIEDLAIASLLL
jgi:L-arginine dehydrogenase